MPLLFRSLYIRDELWTCGVSFARILYRAISIGCVWLFLDAFDFFRKLRDRGLPLVILRFLLSWYGSQECLVRWGLCSSASFGFSNGVCQGSILSPFLFALYLDGLLSELVECGVGCHWGNLFAGCFCAMLMIFVLLVLVHLH